MAGTMLWKPALLGENTNTVFGRRFKFQIEAGRENWREKRLSNVGGKEQCQLVNIHTDIYIKSMSLYSGKYEETRWGSLFNSRPSSCYIHYQAKATHLQSTTFEPFRLDDLKQVVIISKDIFLA